MENTTIPNQTPVTPPTPPTATVATPAATGPKLLLPIVLLVLATVFWLWSISYRDSHHKMQDGTMMRNDAPAPVVNQDADLDSEIDSSMTSQSELELKGIDEEF